MLNSIDKLLDGITMYRLVLYYLVGLLLVALGLSLFGVLSFSPVAILFSISVLLIACYIFNTILASIFKAPVNAESWIITGFILSLIMSPSASIQSLPAFSFAALFAIGSKYILSINKKHVFNPAALGVALLSIVMGVSASWWVGTLWMMPFVIVGGLLVAKKLQREDMILAFFVGALAASLFLHSSTNPMSLIIKILEDSSLLFLGFVMLTEPLTMPPRKSLQIVYGIVVGLLFPPQIHILSIYSTPELALLVGNIFSFIVSPKIKVVLPLAIKKQIDGDIIDFTFPMDQQLKFKPGQYMEWTLPHNNMDSRGNRRYFTIASSPTEIDLRLGIKFYPNGSSFKKAMQNMAVGAKIVGGQIAGDFTLPKDKNQKCVFIAGGIGITPYRSMIKYLLDKKESRSIVLLYSNKTASEIVYQNIFDVAAETLKIKTVYTLTDTNLVPKNWKGEIGRIDEKMISEEVPDYKERLFYLSGPQVMVNAFEQILKDMGIPGKQIKVDFFPGFV